MGPQQGVLGEAVSSKVMDLRSAGSIRANISMTEMVGGGLSGSRCQRHARFVLMENSSTGRVRLQMMRVTLQWPPSFWPRHALGRSWMETRILDGICEGPDRRRRRRSATAREITPAPVGLSGRPVDETEEIYS